jgi:hypothetical protein
LPYSDAGDDLPQSCPIMPILATDILEGVR